MDANGVLSAVFDPGTNTLRTTEVAGPAGPYTPNEPDANGAWSRALVGDTLKVVYV